MGQVAGDRPLCDEERRRRPPGLCGLLQPGAATRSSAGVSPSSRVRPPCAQVRCRAFATQSAAPSSIETVERRPDRVAGLPASSVPASGRSRARAMPEPCRRDLRPRCAVQRPGRGTNLRDRPPLERRRQDHGIGDVGRAPTRGRRELRPPPRHRGPDGVLDPAELEQHLDLVAGPPADAGLTPPELEARRSAFSNHSAAPDRSPLHRATSPRTAMCCGGPRRTARSEVEPPFRVLPGQLELASVDGDDRTSGDGPGAPRARTGWRCRGREPRIQRRIAQLPAQNSTQARPQSARALLGSSRSRHSWYSRSSNARASSLPGELRGCSRPPASPPARAARRRRRSGSRALARVDPPAPPLPRRTNRGWPASRGLALAAPRRRAVGELERPACMVERWLGGHPRKPTVDLQPKRRRGTSRSASSSIARNCVRSPARQGGQGPRRAGACSLSGRRSARILRARVHSPALR